MQKISILLKVNFLLLFLEIHSFVVNRRIINHKINFSSIYFKHLIYVKQSDCVSSQTEIYILENLFKFQKVNLNEEKYPNLESLGYFKQ